MNSFLLVEEYEIRHCGETETKTKFALQELYLIISPLVCSVKKSWDWKTLANPMNEKWIQELLKLLKY